MHAQMRELLCERNAACMFQFDHLNGVEYGFIGLAALSFVALVVGVGALLIG